MSVVQELPISCSGPAVAAAPTPAPADGRTGDEWADQTRRILTRDLLTRAAHARPAEARAIQFRALHLNLPLVGEVAERLGVSAVSRRRVEHHGLNGLFEAIRRYDPCGEADFPEFAAAYVEDEIRAHLPMPTLRLAAHRVAVAIARV